MKEVPEHLNTEWKDINTRAHFISSFYRGVNEQYVLDSLIRLGIPKRALGWHAGLTDVSKLLAVDSTLVRQEVISNFSEFEPDNPGLEFYGDPSKTSTAVGKRLIEVIVKGSINQIKYLKKENRK